jgi:cyanobactin maturation PatA/PatG family protease
MPQKPYPTEGGFPAATNHFPPPYSENPTSPAHLSESAELIWTLNIELTPVYALRPAGNFSTEVYLRLVEFLAGQIRDPNDKHYVSRVSIPGILTGETVQLFSGQVVPVVSPHVRGMYSWHENELVTAAMKASGIADPAAAPAGSSDNIRNFLDRVYYELRNLGQTPAERAMNFAATNAFQTAVVFTDKKTQGWHLDTIDTERSPFCRKDSECYDVKLRLFDPSSNNTPRKVYRYTVDVSVEYPVTVGPVRSWSIAGSCFSPCS